MSGSTPSSRKLSLTTFTTLHNHFQTSYNEAHLCHHLSMEPYSQAGIMPLRRNCTYKKYLTNA